MEGRKGAGRSQKYCSYWCENTSSASPCTLGTSEAVTDHLRTYVPSCFKEQDIHSTGKRFVDNNVVIRAIHVPESISIHDSG